MPGGSVAHLALPPPPLLLKVMACLDLLLRWCVLRVVESNTQSLVKVTDMLKAVMDAMAQAGVR